MSLACAKNVSVIVPVETTALTGCMPKTETYMSIVLVGWIEASDKVKEVEPAVNVPVTCVPLTSLIAPILLFEEVFRSEE